MTYYDRQGREMPNRDHDFDGWCAAMRDTYGNPDYRRVAFSDLADSTVSTVWLGIDPLHVAGPPMIFETRVFGGDHDGNAWRWPNECLAICGHDQIVAHLQACHAMGHG